MTSRLWRLAVAASATCGLAACTGTTYDESLETTLVDTAPTSTTSLPATTVGLLDEMLTGARAMSGVITAGGDDAAVLAGIEQRWDVARDSVEGERPELVADFDTAVRVLGTAAKFDRAADADKAAKNLAALVAAFAAR
jgi:glutamate/tyrosine decarboxylase-like PLP-dependent enzyme